MGLSCINAHAPIELLAPWVQKRTQKLMAHRYIRYVLFTSILSKQLYKYGPFLKIGSPGPEFVNCYKCSHMYLLKHIYLLFENINLSNTSPLTFQRSDSFPFYISSFLNMLSKNNAILFFIYTYT